jgi:2-polyprenyl-6-hydroxyphenyl methylase/3-demethylubiquinone-9 3-methyltransferase
MESMPRERYEFGKNWRRFVERKADQERIAIAKEHILSFIKRDDLNGLDFLDIGCGSGIHSLAASQAGANSVHSFDYDRESVAATELMRRRAPDASKWVVEQGDVLDAHYVAALGKWNFVYSWGVLHHTGDVWRAIDNAAKTVADGGLFYIALYSEDVQQDPQFWIDIKRKYNEVSQFGRWRLEWWYIWNYEMNQKISRFGHVMKRIAEYRLTRGMDLFADVRDWLGGWPMQFTRDGDVISYLIERGFSVVNIKTGEACTEFLFAKNN